MTTESAHLNVAAICNVGDALTLDHNEFHGVFFKVASIGDDVLELQAYNDRECTKRRPMADGRIFRIYPKDCPAIPSPKTGDLTQ